MSNKRDSLGHRMKERYESISCSYLTRRVPAVLRIDGKVFHTMLGAFLLPIGACTVSCL